MATVTPPTRPALRERYERRRREVIATAARLFAERGYQETSMSELTAATGLAAGGLYHYIESKDELLIAICDELLDPLLERGAGDRRRAGAAGRAAARAAARLARAHRHATATTCSSSPRSAT